MEERNNSSILHANQFATDLICIVHYFNSKLSAGKFLEEISRKIANSHSPSRFLNFRIRGMVMGMRNYRLQSKAVVANK